jgi:hypothetical protein
MKYLIMLFSLLILVSCADNKEVQNNANEIEEKTNEDKQLEEKLISLFKEKNFEELVNLTVKRDTPLKKDFFHITLAYQELEKINDFEERGLSQYAHEDMYNMYRTVQINLEEVKNPPNEIASEINSTLKLADEKAKYYLKQFNPEKYYESLPDIQIGMTTEEVLNSKWGKPIDINRTTTANGVSEQWVYPNFKYLYFEDGILTTIQE